MRFRHFFLILLLLFCVNNIILSQVGINTSDPKGLLDIVGLTNVDNSVIFTNEGNLDVGTTTPKHKLDVEGTMQIAKSNTETNDISNYLLTSDDSGIGTWQYNAVVMQNRVSTFNIELSVTNLFTTNSRFTVASIPRNELNLTISKVLSPYNNFSLNPIPRGLYAVIINLELVNANSIATFAFSTTAETTPISGQPYGYITISGKKLSTSFLVDLNKESQYNYIYMELTSRSRYMFKDWTNFTYWDKPWEALSSGENYLIKGTIDIIKLG